MAANLVSNQRYIYILLSRTHTVPARLIRFFTGEPYSHSSIALDAELNNMYSFARKHIYNPFNCGFIDEDIETGIFGRDKNIQCSVYRVPVTEEQYQALRKELNTFIRNRNKYKYNYTGLVGVMFGKSRDDGIHFFCSQFISYVFYRSGIHITSKENGLTRPYDFHVRLKNNQIYTGKLSEYRRFIHATNANCEEYDKVAEAI